MEREAIAALAAVLEPLGIVWVVMGAVAANRYRRDVRLTGDVDLVVADHGPGPEALEVGAVRLGADADRPHRLRFKKLRR